MSVSTRTRFEVFKRDGFRCRYCGRTPVDCLLEVDHVVPKAKGGTDGAVNLVTACQDCNRGKSDVPLSESKIAPGRTAKEVREQTKQIAAYLEVCRELDRAKDEYRQYIAEKWMNALGESEVPEDFVTRLVTVVEKHGIAMFEEATAIVARKRKRGISARMYFNGVIRGMVAQRQ